MTIQHFFLTSAKIAPTERWSEAFSEGRMVGPADLMREFAGRKPQSCLVWVSADDPQWKALIRQVPQLLAGVRSVLLSGAPVPQQGLEAIYLGATGYAHAYSSEEVFHEVATVVEHGGMWTGPELLQSLVASATAALSKLPVAADSQSESAKNSAKAWARLSDREAEVAGIVAKGKSNKEAADALFISERTVKAHLGSVFDKLGVRDRLQLALFVASVPPANRLPKGTES